MLCREDHAYGRSMTTSNSVRLYRAKAGSVRRDRLMRRGWWQVLMPLLAARSPSPSSLAACSYRRSEGRRYAEQAAATVTEHAAAARARVEQALNGRLFLVRSLIALVSSNPELTQTEFEEAAGAAAEGVPGVRGLALARNAVATHFFPLAGNEQAIGHSAGGPQPPRRHPGSHREAPVPDPGAAAASSGRRRRHRPAARDPAGPERSRHGSSGTGPGAGKVWGLAVIIVDVKTSSGRRALPTAPIRW